MQPLQAFDHASFHKMIDIAARATKGINIPNRKASRKHIIELFKKNLDNLRLKLTVSLIGLLLQYYIAHTNFLERRNRTYKSDM